MQRKVSKSLSLLIVFTLLFSSFFSIISPMPAVAESAFTETFDNSSNTGTSYTSGSFIGNYDIEWKYNGGRGDLDIYGIDGKGIMFRRQGDSPRIYAESIPGGIGNFSVDLKKAFTSSTARTVELLINGESKGTFTLANDITATQKFTIANINVSGSINLEIRLISGGTSSGAQTTIDNISWTSYDDSGSGEDPVDKVSNVTALPGSGSVDEGTAVTLSTSTEDATVYYAVYKDSSSNEDITFIEYDTPITIDEPLTIRAYATKEDYEDSDIAEFEYTIKSPGVLETIVSAKQKPVGTEVTVKGVVTGLIGNNAFIQDETAGLYLYNGITNISELVVGNIVKVNGILDEFNNLKQIKDVTLIELMSTGNDLPEPVVVTIPEIIEELESKVVKVENLTIKTIPDSTTNNYSIIATDGANDIELRVDRNLNPPITLPLAEYSVGDKVTVTAPVGQFKSNYQLMLRTIEDIVKVGEGEDIAPPEVTNLIPAGGTSTGENLRPEISAEYSDPSGINIGSIKLYLDDKDITAQAHITENKLTYTPSEDLEIGNHIVKIEVTDNAPTPQTAIVTWNFYVGKEEFNFYFGQLHSHTNLSDGQGTPQEAFAWARDRGKADFLGVTDHSNSFDNDTDNEDITDVSQSTSREWKTLNRVADEFTKDGEFIAIAGYEMTWSGSTGGWGHMNTFNTPWFASRNNKNMDLKAYYSKIAQDTDSISQFNHPGNTFGNFKDFGFYSEAADRVIQLIEVANGEGPVRGSGYFPSYEQYTLALDKGWHVAPVNNQDNHKGNWITSNEARTVILASELTKEDLYEAIRKLRVYSTEDSNLEVTYKVNGEIMGTMLNNPEKLNIEININDPDVNDVISKVSIISNGGVVVTSKTFNSNIVNWEFELNPEHSYYYVKVDQQDKDIAVTSPVWTTEVEAVGISKVDVSQDPTIVNEKVELSAEVYNNGEEPITDITVEFYENEIIEPNKISSVSIAKIEQGATGLAKVEWTPEKVGTYTIYARATIKVGGTDKVYTQSKNITVGNIEDFTKILVDGGHSNQYVTGNYAGKIETLKEMMKERKHILNINMDELTAEDLEGVGLLIITDPQGTDNPSYNEIKSIYTAEEIAVIKEFVENGGSIIVTSRADYKDGTGQYSNSAQLNPILAAIGTNLRVNDDEIIDKTSNGGQEFRLYFDQYVSSKYNLTDNIPEGITYSFYSGCSVVLNEDGNSEAIDWLVKGHSTTETLDSDNAGDNVPVQKGNVYAIGAELLPSGAKVIVAGTTFFSDFETASADNQYSNKQITENIFNWIIQDKPVEFKKISDLKLDADNDGNLDLLGQKYQIEGRVTAESVAYTQQNGRNNAFFDVIYVQDETGGITVFGVSQTVLPIGTKVRLTGIVDQYDGDGELQVANEETDLVITDGSPVIIESKQMSTSDSMLEKNEGWLVKVQGIVTRMTENSIYLNDGSGEARVYVNGYIGDGTDNTNMLGKWDPSIKVGDTVSAIGLASQDPEGHRLRVRNTAEIVKIEQIDYPVSIAITASKNEIKVNDTLQLGLKGKMSNGSDATADILKGAQWSSSSTSIATISSSGLVTGKGKGESTITASVGDLSATFGVKVTQSPSSPGGGGSTTPTQPKQSVVKEQETPQGTATITTDNKGNVTMELKVDGGKVTNQIQKNSGGTLTINAAVSSNANQVSVNMDSGLFNIANQNNTTLVVNTGNATITIAPGGLEVVEDANISLSIRTLSEKESEDILSQVSSEEFNLASLVFDFDITSSKGEVKFNKPITMTIKYNSNKDEDPEKLGVYYYNEATRAWEYIGGRVTEEGTMEFTVDRLGIYTAMEYRKTFNDLNTVTWAQKQIEVLAARHIVNGVDNKHYAPNNNITRAEFAKLIVEGLNLKPGNNLLNFSDIKAEDWYKEPVEIAASLGIVTGYDGKFDPNGQISREQMAAMIVRALTYVEPSENYTAGTSSFADKEKISDWAKEAVEIATNKGLVNGLGDGLFAPQGKATRAQSAVIIYRMLDLLDRL